MRTLKILTTLLAFSFTVALPSFANDRMEKIERMDQMEKIINYYVNNKQFMGSVLVAQGNEIILNKGYGSANLEWDIPNTPSTKFRIGSLTKQFTAAGILLLEQQGKIKTSDPVKKYFPDAPAAWEKITIFNLLTHTSGIPNYTSLPEFWALQSSQTTVEKMIQIFRDKPLDFKPNEKMSYSNSGYILLGALIEKISGKSYNLFIQDNIFTPLHMKDSGYETNTMLIAHRAAGYAPGAVGLVNAEFINMSWVYSAGALYSTTEDLLKWERELFDGKLLTSASLKKMTTAYKNDYAFGLLISKSGGKTVIHHNGFIQGFYSKLAFYPETKTTVVVLSNIGSSNAPEEIAAAVGSIAQGNLIKLNADREEIKLPVETLKKYVGVYEVMPSANMSITLEGDQLMSQPPGQGKVPLFAETETDFFVKVSEGQLKFITDTKGRATHAILYQSGTEIKAPRINDNIVQRVAIPVSAEILKKYVGSYQLQPGFNLDITLEGEQLMSQPTGQNEAPLYAESESKFFLTIVDAQIEFEQDASGSVTGLILHQGPNHIKAAKM
jgi:CubicO group peptidase (beta-lactamase class C family)